jgi:hypothetical protein
MVDQSSFGKLTEAWEWATLIIDPADVTFMDKLLADPPLLASASLQESTISPSMVLADCQVLEVKTRLEDYPWRSESLSYVSSRNIYRSAPPSISGNDASCERRRGLEIAFRLSS